MTSRTSLAVHPWPNNYARVVCLLCPSVSLLKVIRSTRASMRIMVTAAVTERRQKERIQEIQKVFEYKWENDENETERIKIVKGKK